ncbi:conserved hypothetical protein [Perkinsus marinus ATCC 50983]|uniref:Radical SAM core domain-containing protein n=1 Tax=Perkinsus marinus (strain ATCC 50983 / TXsc) TaxID=423536 RepID=C5KHT4_PERM5|nr:conserved hypothetical protein [Perkinsus marinus ATCC 50983]EER16146.1 conserved hypothetical protein [Perkinsus marinus ATCC 50983]|eukprot:XP_002784350.1 conserved hypothetical protein [Perkinsus marinus ATCC 50983]
MNSVSVKGQQAASTVATRRPQSKHIPRHAMAWSKRLSEIVECLEKERTPEWQIGLVIQDVFKKGVSSPSAINRVPQGVRDALQARLGESLSPLRVLEQGSADFAHKFLLESRQDGGKIEAVGLDFRSHTSLCVSSQIGCAFNCSFCATGKLGLKRQLSVDEIVGQVLMFRATGNVVDSVSFMGMGEPLANPKIFNAISVMTDPQLVGLSTRRMSISTIGIIPGLVKLTELHPQANVAYSLHSPFPEEREKIMPIQRVYPFAKVFDVLDDRIKRTGRRIWISYLLLKGINDSERYATYEAKNALKRKPA